MAVRRESVLLEVDDRFTREILKAAAATKVLDQALNSLSRSAVTSSRDVTRAQQDTDKFRRSAEQSGPAIDRLSGRLAIMAKAALVLGPALVPIGGVGVAGIMGLASQLGFAAIGMGSLVAATQGVGDALKALNNAALEPTAANLEKARIAMAGLGPEARQFVLQFQALRPVLGDIRDAAAAGWFPGLTEALDSFERLGPRVASIFEAIGTAGGQLVADGADALAGAEWAQFLTFVETEGPEALDQFGRSIGNVVHGMAELWMAFDPLNDDFSNWLLRASRDFDRWAEGLSQTQGFQDFVDYIRRSGPQVERTLGSIAEAVVAIIKAASPLGGPVLEGFRVIADTLKLIAESPAGTKIFTMAAAFVVLNKTLAVTAGLLAKTGFIGAAGAIRSTMPGGAGGGPVPVGGGGTSAFARMRADMATLNRATNAQIRASTTLQQTQVRLRREMTMTVAKGAAAAAAFGVATGAIGDGLGLQNTAMLGLVGTMAGPWGAAVGASIGLMADLSAQGRAATESQKALDDALKSTDLSVLNSGLEKAKEKVDDLTSDREDGLDGWLRRTFDDADAKRVIGEAGDQVEEFEDKIRRTERAAAAFDDAQKRIAHQDQISGWAREAGGAFLDLANAIEKPELSLHHLTARMRAQGRAAAEMGRNLREAIRNGADPTALQTLIDKLGPQAGLALEQLANGGERAANRFNRAWVKTQGQLGRLEGAIEDVGESVNRLPDGTVIRVTAETAKAQSMIQQIKDQVAGIKDKTVRVNVFTNYLRGATLAAQGGRDGDPSTPYAHGGYTGAGGKYEPAGIVHRGEVVIPQNLVRRDRATLLSRYGNLPGMDQLASGGLAGYANGGRVGALDFAGLPAVNLTTASLKELNKALRLSTKALDKERSQREDVLAKMTDLRGSVRGRLTSDLFGQTDAWTDGGGVADVLSTLNADISSGKTLKAQIAQLKKKGLDGAALADLLANADAATIANFAGASAADLRKFELAFEKRASLASSVGSSAASVAYGAELKIQTRQLAAIERREARIEAAIREEHKHDRRSSKRGAGSGSRSRKRG
ncbi:hypothetical protein CFH99_07760 [Nocardioides aromaticivorans]|uniref:Uncharacterized protein n=1 Tax=Nocardioides aromaticivorans TaxID=200618 RepID=A0ABX7PHS9_9ACTN|nr:hypothetical protein CFH99_07760 [Nocardioides aromaticivorans]